MFIWVKSQFSTLNSQLFCLSLLIRIIQTYYIMTFAESCNKIFDEAGRKYMKMYRQMKMYNDSEANPVHYGNK